MTLSLAERLQKLLDNIEKRDDTWFMWTSTLVALATLWGL